MTDKIYQRTKLGESLLSTLQGLFEEEKIDAPEAKQIAADFDEVGNPAPFECSACCPEMPLVEVRNFSFGQVRD